MWSPVCNTCLSCFHHFSKELRVVSKPCICYLASTCIQFICFSSIPWLLFGRSWEHKTENIGNKRAYDHASVRHFTYLCCPQNCGRVSVGAFSFDIQAHRYKCSQRTPLPKTPHHRRFGALVDLAIVTSIDKSWATLLWSLLIIETQTDASYSSSLLALQTI